MQTRAMAAGFGMRDLGDHSLKRGALTTDTDGGIHSAKLKHVGHRKSFDIVAEHLELGDLFDGHPLNGAL